QVDEIVELDDADHPDTQFPLEVLYRGQVRVVADLAAVQRNRQSRDFRAGGGNEAMRLAGGGARGDDVIDNEHAAAQRCADDTAALAVRFAFLAIEGVGHVDVVVLGKRRGGERDQGYAFVGRPEQHVEFDLRGRDGR